MKKSILAILVATVFLVGLSYFTTRGCLRGGVPGGLVVLNVTDVNGQPIKNARLRTIGANKQQKAYKYITSDFGDGTQYQTDNNGKMEFISEGSLIGGIGWNLLWVIPMGGYRTPHFEVILSADGFIDRNMVFWDLYENTYERYDDFPKKRMDIDGEVRSYKVYENTYMMEKQPNKSLQLTWHACRSALTGT